MSALVLATLVTVLLPSSVHAQWVDRAFISATSTTPTHSSIATASNEPAGNMEGAVYDAFPAKTASAIAVALVTGTAKAASATAAAAAAGSIAAGSPEDDGGDKGECKLLGSFAIFVQLALGALALLSLVYKRWRERPQRPVKIWFFDVSKQVFGSVLVHMANVFMSMLTSGRISVQVEPAAVTAAAVSAVLRRFAGPGGQHGGPGGSPGGPGGDDGPYVPNPCSFYLLNLAIDTTLGIPILIFLLRIFTGLVSYTPLGQPPESIQSGHYGNPPNAWWWLKQSLIYFLGLFGMKFCVLVIFLMFPWISRVGDWALGWTEGNEKIQIIFVMMLFPLIMNALQYYIIDSFIKKAPTKEDTEGHSGAGSEGDGYQRVRTDEDLVEAHGPQQRGLSQAEEGDGDKKGSTRSQAKKAASPTHEEYDPEVDGDRTAATGGSSSTTAEDTVSSELYPKE